MSVSSRGDKSSRKQRRVFVHDASGLFAGLPLSLPGEHYTTPKIVSEVRDEYSRRLLETSFTVNRLKVLEAPKGIINEVVRRASEVGELNRLSEADISIIALAYWLKVKGYDPIIVTDDYAVQNIVLHLGLVFMTVKTVGIKEMRRYEVYCPNCGWKGVTNSNSCPRCGFPLHRRIKH